MSLMHVVLLNPPEDPDQLVAVLDEAVTARGAQRTGPPRLVELHVTHLVHQDQTVTRVPDGVRAHRYVIDAEVLS